MENKKGFTLIELAIVLIIIGIIIGAVLKGQDLIHNANMKKLVTKVRHWESSLFVCYDRTGYFPGDINKDGIIDTNPLDTTHCNDTSCKCFQNLIDVPTTAVGLGSNIFYIYVGYDNSSVPTKNIIAICADANCNAITDSLKLEYLMAIDREIDGEANGLTKTVLATDDATVSSGVVNASPSSSDWTIGTTKAAIYYFESHPN